jgi:hypothetical protein
MKSRTLTTTINWSLAACVALLMSTAYLLDGPSDIQTAQAVADDLSDAKQSAINSVATNASGASARHDKGVQMAGVSK